MMNYTREHKKRYNDFSSWTRNKYGCRIQKISVNAGFTCPNRDGTKGTGGCIYCDNSAFSPYYCIPSKTVTEQIEEGIGFFSKKYRTEKYFAYFQAFTNTYGETDKLLALYREALNHTGISGLIISTRPDCINTDILRELALLKDKTEIFIEFGLESTLDRTLAIINRCHTFQDTINALNLTRDAGIDAGVHLILGLPGEDSNDFIHHAKVISGLPVKTLKIHQLQVLKGTAIEKLYMSNPGLFTGFSVDEYISLIIRFLENLNPDIIVERFISESPPGIVISPNWGGLKNYEFLEILDNELERRDTCQGALY